MKRTDPPSTSALTAPQGYPQLLSEIKERIRSAQYEALKAVNEELVGLYWDLGRMIVERIAMEGWGKSVVEQLAADLRMDFPGVGGFSSSNLWRMKAFFEAYHALEKLAPLVREIGWSHNLVILQRCKDPLEREFYLRLTRKFGWSRNVLIHQIDNQTYEKSLLRQTNFDQALTPELRAQAKLAVQDEYTFDFLELGEKHSERELERALVARIEEFLRSPGRDLRLHRQSVPTGGGRQRVFHRPALIPPSPALSGCHGIEGGRVHSGVRRQDAVLSNRIGPAVRQEEENPSIGIILCKEKSRTIVEYALRDARKPIGVATYNITKTLPDELKGQLPTPQEITRLLEDL